jgi:hypothetical protein
MYATAQPIGAKMSKKAQQAEEEKWRREDDARTIKNYIELKREPDRMNKALDHMEMQAAEMRSIRKEAMPRKSRKLGRKATRKMGR